MITAKEARQVSESDLNERSQEELKLLGAKILELAKQGLRSLTMYKGISKPTIEKLKSLEYKVSEHFDQRDGDSWTVIQW